MTFNIVAGVILTLFALGTVAFLTLWSRRIIERINAKAPSSLREIRREMNHGG